MLPPLDLCERLAETGVTAATVRRFTAGAGTLLRPLEPTRECRYSDERAAVLVRTWFCHPEWCLRFAGEVLVVSDYLGARPDAVMGPGETTAVLYRAARPRERVRRVLDLGCGAGTLALLLSRDAGHVVATDINPRAVAFCRYNARLNGISNIEVRTGDLYAPVAGDRFDLIVSQPPYYPGSSEIYLHGGPRGHEIAERVLLGAPAHLTPGGRAVIHASWPLDWRLPRLAGVKLTEHTPGCGEIPGTRHSLVVVEAGEGVTRIDVPPERWGV